MALVHVGGRNCATDCNIPSPRTPFQALKKQFKYCAVCTVRKCLLQHTVAPAPCTAPIHLGWLPASSRNHQVARHSHQCCEFQMCSKQIRSCKKSFAAAVAVRYFFWRKVQWLNDHLLASSLCFRRFRFLSYPSFWRKSSCRSVM